MPLLYRFLLLLALVSAGAAFGAPAVRPREQARYGIYLQDQRIGGMQSRVFDARHAGKPATRMEADMDVKIVALGSPVEQTLRMTYVLDPKGRPLTSSMTMSSAGRTTRIVARYEARQVVCNIDAAGQKSGKVVPIPAGVTLVGDPDVAKGKGAPLKVGQKAVLHFFEPMTLTIHKMETEVVKTETRSLGGKPTRTFLIRTRNSFAGESDTWVDGKGELLEDRSTLGIRIVREDLGAVAPTTAYTPPKDFAVATSVTTAVKIEAPRKVRTLRLKVSGIPAADLLISDTRQQVVERREDGGKWTATYLVQARDLPTRALPVAAPGETGPGLGDAPYLGLSDAAIRARATALAGGETDRALIARRIRAWVKGHMQKPSNIGTPRAAPEILASRDGVCRDYATLFAAVARAAGVPTRVCSGTIYFDGGFYYHAWVECRLTAEEDGWYAFDPTLDDDFVDATHIKFAQGDPLEMYGAVRVVGQIQAEVLEHR
jgi:transglutaminase-like putative cysteine protease